MPPRNMKPTAKPKDLKGTMKRLLSYVSSYKLQLAAVAVCIVISALVSAVGTYMIKDIIDV